MKIIAIGDTHGRSKWKEIVNDNDFDIAIFIGDYFDTHDNISVEQQLSNFSEISAYKKENKDKVILLIGNHDYHYLNTTSETYSGYQARYRKDISLLLHDLIDEGLMQMCFVYDKYIFSHAGVSKTWLRNNEYNEGDKIDIFINNLFINDPSTFEFTIGRNFSNTGDDINQTPIWIRPNSLYKDGVDNFTQVVGHTTMTNIERVADKIILIDTIGTSGEFLTLNF